jgi:hypothetical protein
VAVITGITAGDMSWILTSGHNSIMTGRTRSDDLCVVDQVDRSKNVCVVAILTNWRCLYVCRILANGIGSIVATRTIIADIDVVKVRWYPADS